MKDLANTTVSIGEAAKILHVSAETLRRYEAEGKLPFEVIYTPGGHRKYPVKELEAFAQKTGQEKYLVKLPQVKLTDEQVQHTINQFNKARATKKAKAKQNIPWYPVDPEDASLECDELYDKYSTPGPNGMELPEPENMTEEFFRLEYDFMSGADLEAPESFEWLAKLREEMARRLEYKNLPGSHQERYMAKKLRRDAYNHFGHDACKDILTMPF